MRTILALLIFSSVTAITQDNLDILMRWHLCSAPRTATDTCSWATDCLGLRCLNNVVSEMYFEMPDYVALNSTELQLLRNFPNVTLFSVSGGYSFSVQLYPELSLLSNVRTLDIIPTVTGTIPSEYGQLTQLSDFVLSKARLTGTIPAELANAPINRFEIAGLVGCDLHGKVPNFTRATTCYLSRIFAGGVEDNPSLFCSCNTTCSRDRGYNHCSETCGTIRTTRCNEAVATLGNGYVCIDACRRCGDLCELTADRTAYRCPGDPIPSPPSTSESSRTTPTLDGNNDDPSSSTGIKKLIF